MRLAAVKLLRCRRWSCWFASRLLKKGHLWRGRLLTQMLRLKWRRSHPPPAGTRYRRNMVTGVAQNVAILTYTQVRSGRDFPGALHLTLFEQPALNEFSATF